MWEAVEQFCKNHKDTIAAFGAASTFSAVVVSLVLAFLTRRANKTHIRASVNISVIIHDSIDKDKRHRYVTANITNNGIMPARIPFSFFHWRVPFRRGTWSVIPHDSSGTDPWVPQQKYPVEIAPRASHTFFVSEIDTLKAELARTMGRRDVGKVAFRFLWVMVLTDDGAKFRAKVPRHVRKELRKLRQ